MLDAGERAYAYTKACGIIGKSFVGRRINALAGLHSLNELDRLVFPNLRYDLPGQELLVDLEIRIAKRAVKHVLAVINSFVKPPELLVRQLRSYEYSDLKTCLHCLAGGIKTLPPLNDIGRFRTLRFEAFPDIEAMITGTEFEFVLRKNLWVIKSGNFDPTPLETDLDLHYYMKLKESLRGLSADDRSFAERILAEEISLRNCVWALRLRSYFKKNASETKKHLMDITMRTGIEEIPGGLHEHRRSGSHVKETALAAEAFEMLELPLDYRLPWQGWRWEKFLNLETPGELWRIDPRYFQNAASEYLYQLALYCFHNMPLAVSAIFCYIKLKQFEEDLLTSIAEGIGLGMPGRDVFKLLEVFLA